MDELEQHTTFETDDRMDDFIHIQNTPRKRKTKKGKGKKKGKKGAKAKKPIKDEL